MEQSWTALACFHRRFSAISKTQAVTSIYGMSHARWAVELRLDEVVMGKARIFEDEVVRSNAIEDNSSGSKVYLIYLYSTQGCQFQALSVQPASRHLVSREGALQYRRRPSKVS